MNPDGQMYFDDEDKIPEEDAKRLEEAEYDYSGLAVTGKQLLEQEWTDEDRAAMDARVQELFVAIERLEREQRESEK